MYFFLKFRPIYIIIVVKCLMSCVVDSIRTIQTRIPTPDSVRSSPGTPGMTPSPKPGAGNQSRIPVKQQLSGASRTSVEEDWSEGDQAPKSARVSFKEEKDVRNIVSFNP